MSKNDPIAHKRELMAKIQTEGTQAAYGALLDVCRDKKAPAPARATSATTLFRAAGFLSAKAEDPYVPAEEMTPAQIQARMAELRAAYKNLGDPDSAADDDDDAEGDDDDDDDDQAGGADMFG